MGDMLCVLSVYILSLTSEKKPEGVTVCLETQGFYSAERT